MTYTIEHLELSELVSYLHLQADDTFPDLNDEQRLNTLAEKWHSHAEFCTCRNDNGQLVGIIAFYANQPKTGIAYIPHVYVSREFRGKGLFPTLLQTIISHISPKGYNIIKLEVAKDNIRAQKAYLKQGFRTGAEAGEQSIFMTKTL